MEVRKRKRRRSSAKVKIKQFPVGYTVWSVIYGLAFILLVIVPSFLTTNRLLSNMTLMYGYVFTGFLILHAGMAWASRKSRLVIAGLTILLLVAFSAGFVSDLIKNSGPVQQRANLRVVTYNWLASNKEFDGFKTWVTSQTPDVIAIEEIPDVLLKRYAEIQDIYPYRTPAVKGDDTMILSRYPIGAQRTVRIANRQVVYSRIDVPGAPLNVYALHSQTVTSQELWELKNSYLTAADLIVEKSTEPMLVMGDFNATPWDPLYRTFVASNGLHAMPQLFPHPTRVLNQVFGTPVGAPIDHILAGPDMNLSDCRTAPAMGSDHLPVMCALEY